MSQSRSIEAPTSASERWHFSFAGLMLLLFGIFAALYALSKSRERQLTQQATELRQLLEEEKKKVAPAPALRKGEPIAEDPQSVADNEALAAEIQSGVTRLQALLGVSRQKEKWIETEALPDGGMLIRMIAADLYERGDQRVSPAQKQLLEVLGDSIRQTGRSIRIEAFADAEDSEALARGAGAAGIGNSWELSAMRSAWVAQYWMRRFDFDPAKMEVVAFGKRPGKRRMEVVIERRRN